MCEAPHNHTNVPIVEVSTGEVGNAMRILITGVTGVVGRSVARQLVAAGHMVSGIAPYGHRCLDPDVNFVCTSLRDPVLQHLADEADVVIHLAPIDNDAPGSAGINGVVHVTHAAARAGARLLLSTLPGIRRSTGTPRCWCPPDGRRA